MDMKKWNKGSVYWHIGSLNKKGFRLPSSNIHKNRQNNTQNKNNISKNNVNRKLGLCKPLKSTQ